MLDIGSETFDEIIDKLDADGKIYYVKDDKKIVKMQNYHRLKISFVV